MIVAYRGPMRCGKTHTIAKLIENWLEVDEKNTVRIYDFLNTRNSDRDLAKLYAGRNRVLFRSEFETVDDENCLLVIDEVHFVNVFGRDTEFILFLGENRSNNVLISGLKYDCYNDYRTFEVWHYLSGFPSCAVHVHDLKPREKCHLCGDPCAFYTKPLYFPKGLEDRVGDKYVNVCGRCVYEGKESIGHK